MDAGKLSSQKMKLAKKVSDRKWTDDPQGYIGHAQGHE